MFVIATNLSVWLVSVVDEAVHALSEGGGHSAEGGGHTGEDEHLHEQGYKNSIYHTFICIVKIHLVTIFSEIFFSIALIVAPKTN